MKTISDYTIYCTEEQTRKVLSLGAPVNKGFGRTIVYDNTEYLIPTAEQMLGWIESISTIQLQIEKQMFESGTRYRVWVRNECKPFSDIIEMRNYPTRKEATLSAIDVALGYLSDNKLLK